MLPSLWHLRKKGKERFIDTSRRGVMLMLMLIDVTNEYDKAVRGVGKLETEAVSVKRQRISKAP